MNIIIIQFLYLYFFTSQISCKTVFFKFNEFYDNNTQLSEYQYQNLNLNTKDEDIIFYSDLYNNLLYTIISIGEPNQSMLSFFNLDTNIFVINNQENCYKMNEYNYSYTKSESSEIIKKIEGDDYYPGYLIINDSIKINTIEKNKKLIEEVKDFQFKYELPKRSWGEEDKRDKIFCAEIGFQINKEKKIWAKFIKHLKDNNVINSYKLTFNYSLIANEGYFYIGDYPHEYAPNDFDESQLISTYIKPKSSFSQFRIIMDNIYIKINETERIKISYNEVYFHIELGLIECPMDYYNYIKNIFFKEYLNNSICSIRTMTKDLNYYNMIICEDKDTFKIKNFPSLYLYHSELNKTFILDYNDLFEHKNNKYYFYIIYSTFSGSYWKLGKPFFKKYQITLDLDSKRIIFYNNNNNINNDNSKDNNNYVFDIKDILLIILCLIFFITIFIFIYLYVTKIKKERKKRANELNDDEYEYNGIDNKNSENNQIMEDNNKEGEYKSYAIN